MAKAKKAKQPKKPKSTAKPKVKGSIQVKQAKSVKKPKSTSPKSYSKKQLDAFRKILIDRRAALTKQVTDQDDDIGELRDDQPADPLDMAGNTSTLELMTTLGNHERQELSEIDHALGKIEDGTYGVCEVSGELINEERLKAIPTARFTREVQEQRERSPGMLQERIRRRALLTEDLPSIEEES
jgi:RNA polymerase-binding protein DksA